MASSPGLRRLSWTALALALLLLAPFAGAGYKTYGDIVEGDSTDKDSTRAITDIAAAALFFADDNNDNVITPKVGSTPGEAVYVNLAADTQVSVNDIRIRSGSPTAG